jgi:hypothetical protein
MSAVSVVLLPLGPLFLTARATGAPPGKPASAAKPAAKPPAARPLAGGKKAILKALRQPTSFEFVDTPLSDVVAYFQDKHGIPIVLDEKELKSASVGTDTPITLVSSGISLRSALGLILDGVKLK